MIDILQDFPFKECEKCRHLDLTVSKQCFYGDNELICNEIEVSCGNETLCSELRRFIKEEMTNNGTDQ